MDNFAFWNKHADINPRHTKPITGKAYRGTSPSPQHVIWCLTDMFGPVGQGFGWTVIAEGWQPLGDEVLHWCRIHFWHGSRENGFEAYGQTKALMKTKNGFMSDEDAPKKSLTDAIVKAASHIGVAANIFLGRWDDAKYVADLRREFDEDPPPAAIEPPKGPSEASEGLRQAWAAGVRDRLPQNATPRQKAEAFAEAIIADFNSVKGEQALNNRWQNHEAMIDAMQDRHPDLYDRVCEAYDLKRDAVRCAKPRE